jgi:hypothetical protein
MLLCEKIVMQLCCGTHKIQCFCGSPELISEEMESGLYAIAPTYISCKWSVQQMKYSVLCLVSIIGNLGTSVNTASGHVLDDWVSIVSRSKAFFSSHSVQTDSELLQAPPLMGSRVEACAGPAVVARINFEPGRGSYICN